MEFELLDLAGEMQTDADMMQGWADGTGQVSQHMLATQAEHLRQWAGALHRLAVAWKVIYGAR